MNSTNIFRQPTTYTRIYHYSLDKKIIEMADIIMIITRYDNYTSSSRLAFILSPFAIDNRVPNKASPVTYAGFVQSSYTPRCRGYLIDKTDIELRCQHAALVRVLSPE